MHNNKELLGLFDGLIYLIKGKTIEFCPTVISAFAKVEEDIGKFTLESKSNFY